MNDVSKLDLPREERANPNNDALSLFRGDVSTIGERVQRNIGFLTQGALDQISGPVEPLKSILDRLARGSAHDLSVFRQNLRTLVMSGLERRREIESDALNAWHEAHGGDGEQAMRQATPYMQFALAAGKENSADRSNQDLPSPPVTFRRFAAPEKRGYSLDDAALAASANGLVFNVLFHPDHTFRDADEIKTLVSYLERELDEMIRRKTMAE